MKTFSVVVAATLLCMSHARPGNAQVYYQYTPANYYAATYAPANVQAARYWYAGNVFQKGQCGCDTKSTQKSSCSAQKSTRGCSSQNSSCGCSKGGTRILPALLGRIDAALNQLFPCNKCSSCDAKGGCEVKVSKAPTCGCGKSNESKFGGRGTSLLSNLGRCRSCEAKGKSQCGCRRKLLGCKSGCDTNVPMQMDSDPYLRDSEPPRPVPSLDVPTPMPFSSNQQPNRVWSIPSVYQAAHENVASKEPWRVTPITYLQTTAAPSQPARLSAPAAVELKPVTEEQNVNPLRTHKLGTASNAIINPLRD